MYGAWDSFKRVGESRIRAHIWRIEIAVDGMAGIVPCRLFTTGEIRGIQGRTSVVRNLSEQWLGLTQTIFPDKCAIVARQNECAMAVFRQWFAVASRRDCSSQGGLRRSVFGCSGGGTVVDMLPYSYGLMEAMVREQRKDRERAIQRISLAYIAQANRPPRRSALRWVGVQLERMGRRLQGPRHQTQMQESRWYG